MTQQAPSLLIHRGKERIGAPILHVEGKYVSPKGAEGVYQFNVPRRRLFNSTERQLMEIRKRLDALPGTPEGMPSLTKGKAGPKETVDQGKTYSKKVVRQGVEQMVEGMQTTDDIKPAIHVAKSLYQQTRQTEQAHHRLLASDNKVVYIGPIYSSIADGFMYAGTRVPAVVAKELIETPEKGVADSVKYLAHRYIGEKAVGEKMSIMTRVIKHPATVFAVGLIPAIGTAFTFVDDAIAVWDSRKPGSKRGKAFQWTAALTSTAIDAALATATVATFLETAGFTGIAGDILTSVVNVAFSPAKIEHAKFRIDDKRYMLELLTASRLLSPDSGITDTKRRQIARASVANISPLLGEINATLSDNRLAGDPKYYHSGLMKQLYTDAQSFLASASH